MTLPSWLTRHPPPPRPRPPSPPSAPLYTHSYAPAHPTTRPRKKSWLQRKLFLFEVTFCPYVMTPSEKWAFYTFLFLFLGLFAAAVALYLPQHMQTVARRAYFYLVGDDSVIREVDVLDYLDMRGSAELSGSDWDAVNGAAAAISLGQEELKSYMQS
ncbi:hypothetical protein Dda_8282 [Drechslerella dactyloides]|uniref:Uncharacterized protein n=1 Tax=Drechslerella dactyloides TaxID=74499 RepID=A0AAD6NI31_DREDA|nr:hypothetical protein Dda_8282 [Drechslerella dactyloides]